MYWRMNRPWRANDADLVLLFATRFGRLAELKMELQATAGADTSRAEMVRRALLSTLADLTQLGQGRLAGAILRRARRSARA